MFAGTLMTDLHETAALIALLRKADRGWHRITDAVESAGSALTVLQAPGEGLEGGGSEPTLFDDVPGQGPDPDLTLVIAEIEAWAAEGMHVLTVLDPEYPTNLRTVHNRPPLLFVKGRLEPSDARSVAVVGARKASERGLEAARLVATEISEAGFTVVSGLAAGVDAAAHQAALTRGARTVAVIGTGLRRSYPPENAALQRRLMEEHAVVSQFWPDAPPTRRSFPMRNAVMSGFSLATVVIEASQTSGARMQARLALEHGRPVFLHKALLVHDWARSYVDRPGTYVIESGSEVVTIVERLTSAEIPSE
jgi:DNA processing protein